MFGLLAFGVVFAGAWLAAESTEQSARKRSKDKGVSFYMDKNGFMRHTDTGRKFTGEEIGARWGFKEPSADLKAILDEEYTKKKYYGVMYYPIKQYSLSNGKYIHYYLDDMNGTMEVFDDGDEALAYAKKMREEYEGKIKVLDILEDCYVRMYSQSILDIKARGDKVHYNFERS